MGLNEYERDGEQLERRMSSSGLRWADDDDDNVFYPVYQSNIYYGKNIIWQKVLEKYNFINCFNQTFTNGMCD
jgi:hypothetical protein